MEKVNHFSRTKYLGQNSKPVAQMQRPVVSWFTQSHVLKLSHGVLWTLYPIELRIIWPFFFPTLKTSCVFQSKCEISNVKGKGTYVKHVIVHFLIYFKISSYQIQRPRLNDGKHGRKERRTRIRNRPRGRDPLLVFYVPVRGANWNSIHLGLPDNLISSWQRNMFGAS